MKWFILFVVMLVGRSSYAEFPVPYGEPFILDRSIYAGWYPTDLEEFKTFEKANDEAAMDEALHKWNRLVLLNTGTTVYYMGTERYHDKWYVAVRLFGNTQHWYVQ